MDGFEALKRIRSNANLKHIIVCILTTSHYEDDKIKAMDYGANAYYSKPMSLIHLHEIAMEIFSNYLPSALHA
jgi:DNA-binding response OmpR family regulator